MTCELRSETITYPQRDWWNIGRVPSSRLQSTPAEVVKRHEIDITAIIGITTVASSHKYTIIPILAYVLVVPSDNAIHDLILNMDKQAFVNLEIGIRSHTKIMAISIAISPIEVAV